MIAPVAQLARKISASGSQVAPRLANIAKLCRIHAATIAASSAATIAANAAATGSALRAPLSPK